MDLKRPRSTPKEAPNIAPRATGYECCGTYQHAGKRANQASSCQMAAHAAHSQQPANPGTGQAAWNADIGMEDIAFVAIRRDFVMMANARGRGLGVDG